MKIGKIISMILTILGTFAANCVNHYTGMEHTIVSIVSFVLVVFPALIFWMNLLRNI